MWQKVELERCKCIALNEFTLVDEGFVERFPGAFLIPYFVMLCIEGIPIFYLELAIGQRLRKGAIGVWNQVSPFLGGIGVASAVASFNVALYYNTIIAWCLFYFVQVTRTSQ